MRVDISSALKQETQTTESEDFQDYILQNYKTDEQQTALEDEFRNFYGDICHYKISQLDGNDSVSTDSDYDQPQVKKRKEEREGFEEISRQEQAFFRGHEREYKHNLKLHEDLTKVKSSDLNETQDSCQPGPSGIAHTISDSDNSEVEQTQTDKVDSQAMLNKVVCPKCGNLFHKKSLERHMKKRACTKKK